MSEFLQGAFAVAIAVSLIVVGQWFAFMPLRRRIKEAKRSAKMKSRFDAAGEAQKGDGSGWW